LIGLLFRDGYGAGVDILAGGGKQGNKMEFEGKNCCPGKGVIKSF
jgi:hypothetical protein